VARWFVQTVVVFVPTKPVVILNAEDARRILGWNVAGMPMVLWTWTCSARARERRLRRSQFEINDTVLRASGRRV